MSGIAMPAVSNSFGPVPVHGGPRLGLIAVVVWIVVLAGQIALSGSGVRVCHGTTEALRQLVSFQA